MTLEPRWIACSLHVSHPVAVGEDLDSLIVTRQQAAGWGKSVVERLATDLQARYVGNSGLFGG